MAGSDRVRVLIVDDSALVRQMLTELLNQDPGIEVVGTASDPYLARDKIKRLHPHVLTLDVEMPRMDGLTFLRNLMRLHPMPVVMVSSLTEAGAETTLEALALGAVDFVTKPRQVRDLEAYAEELIAKIKAAARVPPPLLERPRSRTPPRPLPGGGGSQAGIIAIGASTGGTEAIQEILAQLPADLPPIVITQHIPAMFSAPFARRLDRHCALSVREARHGEELHPGCAYVAPGSHHLRVLRAGGRLCCCLDGGEPVNRHRPSVDVLFHSVAKVTGARGLGILLTGMGSDGARGLLAMRQAGAVTIAQDEASSIVWGMPGTAVRCNAAEKVLPLACIAEAIQRWVRAQASQ